MLPTDEPIGRILIPFLSVSELCQLQVVGIRCKTALANMPHDVFISLLTLLANIEDKKDFTPNADVVKDVRSRAPPMTLLSFVARIYAEERSHFTSAEFSQADLPLLCDVCRMLPPTPRYQLQNTSEKYRPKSEIGPWDFLARVQPIIAHRAYVTKAVDDWIISNRERLDISLTEGLRETANRMVISCMEVDGDGDGHDVGYHTIRAHFCFWNSNRDVAVYVRQTVFFRQAYDNVRWGDHFSWQTAVRPAPGKRLVSGEPADIYNHSPRELRRNPAPRPPDSESTAGAHRCAWEGGAVGNMAEAVRTSLGLATEPRDFRMFFVRLIYPWKPWYFGYAPPRVLRHGRAFPPDGVTETAYCACEFFRGL
eukprot:GDKH01000140.1.p1 GENE.GDKH01000140.1~~GDKH01000140.1.p1  ORF type:complete len:367 (-),score=16.18 GDKH01000140.1:74-1174(-)